MFSDRSATENEKLRVESIRSAISYYVQGLNPENKGLGFFAEDSFSS